MTVYTSPGDKALTLSQFLRAGRLQESAFTREQVERVEHYQFCSMSFRRQRHPASSGAAFFMTIPTLARI